MPCKKLLLHLPHSANSHFQPSSQHPPTHRTDRHTLIPNPCVCFARWCTKRRGPSHTRRSIGNRYRFCKLIQHKHKKAQSGCTLHFPQMFQESVARHSSCNAPHFAQTPYCNSFPSIGCALSRTCRFCGIDIRLSHPSSLPPPHSRSPPPRSSDSRAHCPPQPSHRCSRRCC
jgi:hypothetical protein